MWIAAGIVLVIVLLALGYLALLDANFSVRREREIVATPAAVFAAIVDLKSWPEWSPWLLHDPANTIVYSQDFKSEGGSYSWDSEIIGAGKLSHLTLHPDREIYQQLELLRPYRSTSTIHWKLENRGETTLLSWEMQGRMPFPLRFMASRMDKQVGPDFELGLARLGGYLNANMPHPELAIAGKESLDDFNYWAIPFQGNLRQLESARGPGIESLQQAVGAQSGLPLMLYQRFKPASPSYRAEIAVPIGTNPPASNFTRREFKGGAYYKMTLDGDVTFLPLAWHALTSHCRMQKLKLDAKRPALEIYVQGPHTASAADKQVTALYLPIR